MNYVEEIPFLEIGGFTAGHASDEEAATGCTVLLFDQCSPSGVSVRGGGPASRETPLLDPLAASSGLHGILLSGGSAFGLDAAGGVMRFLEERGIGFDVGVTKVPLVCQSCVFDLAVGRMDVRPDAAMAYAACQDAWSRKETKSPLPEGNAGVGSGCTVGKYRGTATAMKSGLGTFALRAGEFKIGAIVAVNALGDVFDIETGRPLAGMLNPEHTGFSSTEEALFQDIASVRDLFTGNTTIGAVLTNGAFTKAEAGKIAAMTHNGLARTIRPVHTTADGDSVYAVSVGSLPADVNAAGTLAAYVMGKAINRAVLTAKGSFGLPAATELGF